MSDDFTSINFRVDGEVVEMVNHDSVPEIGERVEVGVRCDETGERLDPGVTSHSEWVDGEYQTVLEARVEDVTRHYHTARNRSELTVYVDLEVEDDGAC